MTAIPRRRVLQLSGAGALSASTGGLAAILASGRAPAYAQATQVHWLRWSDFVPASDQVLKQKIVPQAEKDLGIKLNLEFINANDIQAGITSSVQSGSGPDIIMVVNNWPQLYIESVADPERPIGADAFVGRVLGGILLRRQVSTMMKVCLVAVLLLIFAAAWKWTPLARFTEPEQIRNVLAGFSEHRWGGLAVFAVCYTPRTLALNLGGLHESIEAVEDR